MPLVNTQQSGPSFAVNLFIYMNPACWPPYVPFAYCIRAFVYPGIREKCSENDNRLEKYGHKLQIEPFRHNTFNTEEVWFLRVAHVADSGSV
jgi:hypothetical protein